jgi:hypothetical protein
MTTMTERVEAGAAWLDVHEPGWLEKIDLDTLFLGSACDCILGQLATGTVPFGGEWRDIARSAGIESFSEDYDLGFNTEEWDDYEGLTLEWTALIKARRAS